MNNKVEIKATERQLLIREVDNTYGLPHANQIPDIVTTSVIIPNEKE
ncbi:hypothetical protein [Sporolactobacillus nakayamae]|nr:hypothetical protein [Sporolactobacillus nakayamae]